ncbi:sodium- and chloride-dependent glycine transporter 1-like [Littorina saxatilis]|uniref:Transporter n=1 Tax=Littorina saxatilis TaxID=31220 RepID=A0AAN9BS78_9CAEN
MDGTEKSAGTLAVQPSDKSPPKDSCGDVEKGEGGEVEVRAVWGRQLEFILTMVGYAVGLGNVWRFPYLCYKNGGGAFLVPYVICLVLLGIPVFGLEVSFGQFGGRGPISIWGLTPTFKGVGYAAVMVTVIVAIYYTVIISWALYYLVMSMAAVLPWSQELCTDCRCIVYGYGRSEGVNANATALMNVTAAVNSTGLNCSAFNSSDALSPSEIYFYENVLKRSSSIAEPGDVQIHLLIAHVIGWAVVLLVLSKGIQSLGKVVYVTAIFPYILLTVMLVRVAMLEGAYDGIIFYLKPDWSKLSDANVWSDAAVQIFFSLSACQGGLIALSSYNKFDNNVLRDSLMVPIINCATSIYAGFVVFSVLGYMANLRGVPVANVTQGGPGLAFVVYPEAVSQMPLSPVWAILFFIMVVMLGFSTAFSVVETIMTSFIDEFPEQLGGKKRSFYFRIFVVVVCCFLGLPMLTQGGSYLLDLVDNYVVGFPTLFVGFFELIVIAWIYGHKEFSKDVKAMIKRGPYKYFIVCWVFVSPVMLLGVIIFKAYQYVPLTANTTTHYPVWAEVLGWGVIIFPISFIPGWFYYYSCKGGLWTKMKELHQPLDSWTSRRQLSNDPEMRPKTPTSETSPEMSMISTPGDTHLPDQLPGSHGSLPIKLPRYHQEAGDLIQDSGVQGVYTPRGNPERFAGYENRAYDGEPVEEQKTEF